MIERNVPFYVRRDDETIPDFVTRIAAVKPAGPLLVEQPRRPGRTGRPNGRPRGDADILAALTADSWTLAPVVVERTGKSYRAVLKALYRAELRGLIRHKRGTNGGYRRRTSP